MSASAREAKAFEAAVAPLLPRLRAVARRLVADQTLAEDAIQEALLRAYRFWDRRRGPEGVGRWQRGLGRGGPGREVPLPPGVAWSPVDWP